MSFSMPCGSNSKIVVKGTAILNILCLKFNPLFKCDFHVIKLIDVVGPCSEHLLGDFFAYRSIN